MITVAEVCYCRSCMAQNGLKVDQTPSRLCKTMEHTESRNPEKSPEEMRTQGNQRRCGGFGARVGVFMEDAVERQRREYPRRGSCQCRSLGLTVGLDHRPSSEARTRGKQHRCSDRKRPFVKASTWGRVECAPVFVKLARQIRDFGCPV